MATVAALARLSLDDLSVEAGGSTECLIAVDSSPEIFPDAFSEYGIAVEGLPARWYSLSTPRLRVEAGQSAEALLVIHPPHRDPDARLGSYDFAVTLTPSGTAQPIVLPAHLQVLAPGAATMQSWLLDYLPALYRTDLFLARFLLIFQSLLEPIEQTIDHTHLYLDPGLAPASFLPWLAQWVGLSLDPTLEEPRQRELIRQAVELARWKGTRRGLREELRIRTGNRALIVENFDGMRLGQDAALGLNTHLGVRSDQFISVTLAVDGGREITQHEADALIEELKPAHVGHLVRTVEAPRGTRGGDRG